MAVGAVQLSTTESLFSGAAGVKEKVTVGPGAEPPSARVGKAVSLMA
jgi:hypothetical protein